ncbi:PrpF protein [Penicillium ucsense]|uniref:PrpF protein n=1 Tax=Penicillium ucsense TaxID=2839758 RepID=A0A8J8W9B8_9EURO|nr:PrpF protein [Penicillium ucsense]KAF7736490.1 PrpF protein [Penicillium ucsense]
MGSAQANSRQVNGVGGATSTTSKVAIVAKSKRSHIDVDYTFVQVAPDQPKLDMTGNCGNIASGVGPFSLDEGLVKARPGQSEINIRIFNTNTEQVIVETVQVAPDGSSREDGEYELAGVPGTASPIKLAFVKPQGSMTGTMFPCGLKQRLLRVDSPTWGIFSVRVSLVDAANPFVLVDASSLPVPKQTLQQDVHESGLLAMVEDIRREGAVQFGLATDVLAASMIRGTPKIAFLSAPSAEDANDADIEVLSFSMGKAHPSLQLTGAVCIAAAMAIPDTVAWDLARGKSLADVPKHGMSVANQEIATPVPVGIRHPSGIIHTETVLEVDHTGDARVERVAVMRTARRLFEGNVYY